jgi:hypothetical protein
MPKPIPVALRQEIVTRHEKGEPLAQIAREVGRPYDSVCKVWTLYRREGRITPNYQNCGRKQKQASRRVVRAALWLKRAHPGWGGRLIRTLIGQKWADEYVPDERTLQRWFRQAGVHSRRQGRKPHQRVKRGQTAHAVWEMDSKQTVVLANGEEVSWLLMSDEASGAMLHGTVFPHPLCRRDKRRAGTGQSASAFCGVGNAPGDPAGQWDALEHSDPGAVGVGLVVDWVGGESGIQSAPPLHGQWCS